MRVGFIGLRGYKTVSIMGKRYYVHRLIWLMSYGYLPDLLDHIDRDKTNNKLSNLRVSSKNLNALNLKSCHKDNKSGILGVTIKGNRFIARFKDRYLGSFPTAKEAHTAYELAKYEGA